MPSAVCREINDMEVKPRNPVVNVSGRDCVRRELGDMSIRDALSDASHTLSESLDMSVKIINFLRYQDPHGINDQRDVEDMQSQVYDICDKSSNLATNLDVIAAMLGMC